MLRKKNLILLFLILTFCNCTHYSNYVPLEFDGENFIENKKLISEKHKENFIKVLKYYDENWKFEDGNLLIDSNIDEELLWNYTSKANDTIWLKTHTLSGAY